MSARGRFSLGEIRQRFFMRLLARIGEPAYSWLKAVFNRLAFLRNPEKISHPCVNGGLHPEKTIYVIDDLSPFVGLATWYDNVLGGMERAVRMGWIPVVVCGDSSGNESGNSDDRGDWYTYFRAVSEVAPEDLPRCRNVVRPTSHIRVHKRYNPQEIAMRHRLAEKAAFNESTLKFIKPRFDVLFGTVAPEDCVGIYFRGTDYRKKNSYCPAGHPAVLEYEEFFDRIIRVLKRWNVPGDQGDRLFFVSDEQEAVESFVNRFPKGRYVVKPRFSAKCFLPNTPIRVPEGTTFRENNLMYLLDLYALSRCGWLIGPMNGGLMMALNMNGNRYKGVHVLNTGVN